MKKEQGNERWKNAWGNNHVFFFTGYELLVTHVNSQVA